MSGMNIILKKIVSGCQTGADTAGLVAANALGLATGGWVPRDYRDENGHNREFMIEMGCKPCDVLGYEMRTALNVRDSDATIIFGDITSGGSKLTLHYVQKYKKPNLHLDYPWRMADRRKYFIEWLGKNKVKVLNCAGNRESRNPGIEVAVTEFLLECLSEVVDV